MNFQLIQNDLYTRVAFILKNTFLMKWACYYCKLYKSLMGGVTDLVFMLQTVHENHLISAGLSGWKR